MKMKKKAKIFYQKSLKVMKNTYFNAKFVVIEPLHLLMSFYVTSHQFLKSSLVHAFLGGKTIIIVYDSTIKWSKCYYRRYYR